MAPMGASSKESPRLPSVKENFSLMPGIAATQLPNSKLEKANNMPTANTGFKGRRLLKFLNSTFQK